MCAVRGSLDQRLSVIAIASLVVPILTSIDALAQTRATGFVKVLTGTATIVRAGQTLPVTLGDAILQDDTLRTGPDGQLGLTLRDETRLSLGPNTQLTLTTFAFSPGEGQLGLVVRVLNGVMAYISGRIAALAPESIRIETPSSIIGVRGTHVLVSAEQLVAPAPGSATRGAVARIERSEGASHPETAQP